MPNELTLKFDLCFLTNEKGEPLDKDNKILDLTATDWKNKAVFVPVLRDALQDSDFPPNNPQTIPKAFHVDGEGYRRNPDDQQPDAGTHTPKQLPKEVFPNDVLYHAVPYHAPGKK